MKKVITVVLTSVASVIVAGIMAVGCYLAVVFYNQSITHFDEYQILGVLVFPEGLGTPDTSEQNSQYSQEIADAGYDICYPEFLNSGKWGYSLDLVECYGEVDNACRDYAVQIAHKYNNKAVLNAEVDYTPTVLTITFTGTGYPEDGEPENLDRTYIFDIDGAGRDKLPILLNKSEIFGE